MTGGRAGGRARGAERAAGVSGIVLAGGRSSRFGRDKLAEPIDGEPLLWRPIRALAAAGCAEVVVVLAPDAPEPALPLDLAVPVRFARDPEPFAGPLVGIRSGLKALAGSALAPVPRAVLVVGGDQPTLVPAVLAELVHRARAAGHPAALADATGRTRPLPCGLLAAPALAAAERLLAAGERRPRALLIALDAISLPFADWGELDPDAATLRDIDAPEDLAPAT